MNPAAIGLHVLGGGVAILSGYGALAIRKGSRAHAAAGSIFIGSMLLMATTGGLMAASKGDPVTTLAGPIVLYFVGTSWRTARLRSGSAGQQELWALGIAVALAATFLAFGAYAVRQPTGRIGVYPAAICFVWAGLMTLAGSLDLKFLLRRRLAPHQRIARHLWRMCVALFIAAGSFFIGQQKVMPAEIRGSWGLFVAALAPFVLMLFWLISVRFGKRFRARGTSVALLLQPELA